MTLAPSACTAQKTQEGEVPDVQVEARTASQYEAEAPEGYVNSRTVEVEVPDIDVEMTRIPDERSPAGSEPAVSPRIVRLSAA